MGSDKAPGEPSSSPPQFDNKRKRDHPNSAAEHKAEVASAQKPRTRSGGDLKERKHLQQEIEGERDGLEAGERDGVKQHEKLVDEVVEQDEYLRRHLEDKLEEEKFRGWKISEQERLKKE